MGEAGTLERLLWCHLTWGCCTGQAPQLLHLKNQPLGLGGRRRGVPPAACLPATCARTTQSSSQPHRLPGLLAVQGLPLVPPMERPTIPDNPPHIWGLRVLPNGEAACLPVHLGSRTKSEWPARQRPRELHQGTVLGMREASQLGRHRVCNAKKRGGFGGLWVCFFFNDWLSQPEVWGPDCRRVGAYTGCSPGQACYTFTPLPLSCPRPPCQIGHGTV